MSEQIPSTEDLPNLGDVIGPILAEAPEEHLPYVIAFAERLAAKRYRVWASQIAAPEHRDQLLACADREEEIASRVEALSDAAAKIQSDFLAAHPDVESAYASLFEGRPLADQLRIQAAGERLGAATWRGLAQGMHGDTSDTVASCAPLEEQSAQVLEELLAAGV